MPNCISSLRSKYVNYEISIADNFVKVAQFRQIWSHWRVYPIWHHLFFCHFDKQFNPEVENKILMFNYASKVGNSGQNILYRIM